MLQHETDKCVQLPRAEVIARLNDALRKTGTGGTVMVTRSVTNLTLTPRMAQARRSLISKVCRTYSTAFR